MAVIQDTVINLQEGEHLPNQDHLRVPSDELHRSFEGSHYMVKACEIKEPRHQFILSAKME